MSEKKSAKGFYVTCTKAFIEQSYDEATRDKILQSLSPEVRDALPRAERTVWYPLRYETELLHGIEVALPDRWEVEIVKCGHFVAADAVGSFLKLIIKVLTPKLFASQFGIFWRRYHDFGEMRSDVSNIEQNRLVMTAPAYDYVHLIGVAWIEAAFRAFGKADVKVTSNGTPGERIVRGDTVIWNVTWGSQQ